MVAAGDLRRVSQSLPIVILARHGETDDNLEPLRFQGRTDTPLNARGLRQAEQLADTVAGLAFEEIWTSDLQRAIQTAKPIADRIGVEPTVDPRLSEGNRGRWEGLVMNDVAEQEPELFEEWRSGGGSFRFPDGESLLEHQQRVTEALDQITASGRSTLVICHGGSIRTALCQQANEGLDGFHKWHVPNCGLVRL